ncbi:MAG: TetR/AcrR family transcriptional regulator, ethionamide resistance regulator, partial [Pseudonocardiales bacterium]|nr:TetR/AcrR family transcriptional regulator, ethionamide resistance regulator [Pseudonocardiales bacterium]
VEAGRILPLDARETARALCLMNDRYLLAALGHAPTTAPETVVETLATIWTRTLYGARPT